MNYNNNLANDIWYGEANNELLSDDVRFIITRSLNDADKALAIGEGLKLGDFSFKRDLVSLLNSSQEDNVINYCLRVFASTATHDDLMDDNNFAFLATANQPAIETFLSCATDFMSICIVPYLLALLEEWDGTELGTSIRDKLNAYFGLYAEQGEDCTVHDIGLFCAEKVPQYDKNTYYYRGKAAFPGDLIKVLTQQVQCSLQTSGRLRSSVIPELLSIWSGKKCPASYFTVVTEEVYGQLLQYIDELSMQKWERGVKYFYGHEIH